MPYAIIYFTPPLFHIIFATAYMRALCCYAMPCLLMRDTARADAAADTSALRDATLAYDMFSFFSLMPSPLFRYTMLTI